MKDDLDKKIKEPEEEVLADEEDDIVEFVYNADGEEDLKATLKKTRKDLKEAQKEKQEYLTNWQRERADFQNYKKDEESRISRVKNLTREMFVEELLPVLDAYDMAFANREAWEKVDKNWRMGVEYIHQQLIKVLADNGVSEISPEVGDEVDPNIHEALETTDNSDESKSGKIAEVTQKGYKSTDSSGQGRIIRPARVKVYK